MTVRQRPWWQFPKSGAIARIALTIACLTTPVHAVAGERDFEHPSHPGALFRAKGPAAVSPELLFVSRRQEAKRWPVDTLESILKGGDLAGYHRRQAGREPDRRGDQLPGPRDASQWQARFSESRDSDPWVSLGAPWPKADRGTHVPSLPNRSSASRIPTLDRSLWSLQPVRRSAVPVLAGSESADWAGWSRNPIDNFILHTLLNHGLTPAAEADKATLIRRVTFEPADCHLDTLDEVDAFLADNRPDAYERLVDRLLASPRYGQRRDGIGLTLFAMPSPTVTGRMRFAPMPGVTATMSSGPSTPTNLTTVS